jgi:hypothetical protein
LYVVFFCPFVTRVEGTHDVIMTYCADNLVEYLTRAHSCCCHLQHTLNPPLYEKYCTGMYRTETLCTIEGLNKSVCQARLNSSQPLLLVETCTRSRTPVWRLMQGYWTCRSSARPDYRDCTVLVYFIHYGNEGTSSSVSDVDRYVIIRKVTRFYSRRISGVRTPMGDSDTHRNIVS